MVSPFSIDTFSFFNQNTYLFIMSPYSILQKQKKTRDHETT